MPTGHSNFQNCHSNVKNCFQRSCRRKDHTGTLLKQQVFFCFLLLFSQARFPWASSTHLHPFSPSEKISACSLTKASDKKDSQRLPAFCPLPSTTRSTTVPLHLTLGSNTKQHFDKMKFTDMNTTKNGTTEFLAPTLMLSTTHAGTHQMVSFIFHENSILLYFYFDSNNET